MNYASLLPGYRMLEPLGWGTLGRVYAAENEFDGAPLVVKVLHEDLARDPVLRERFFLAAAKARAVVHPNLVRILGVPEQPATAELLPYVSMERCAGSALSDYLRKPLLPIELACQIGVGICQGLIAAHAAGLVHADLKPSNILVAWNRSGPPDVKLLDLGFTQLVFGKDDNLRWANGTPRYLAPELILGKDPDERSDVYSVAALLYEMLGGVPVVDTDDDFEALKAAIAGRWRPLIDHNPLLPEALVRAVEGGLHTEPSKRLQSAHELLRQLLEFSALPLSAHRPGQPEQVSQSNVPASTRLNQAPRPRSATAPSLRELTSPVFPKSPAAPNIDPTGGAPPGEVETLEDDEDDPSPGPRSSAPGASDLPLDLLVLGAGLGVGCALVWWGLLSG